MWPPFVYAVLALGSVAHGSDGDFVPHASITVALALVLVSLGVLIFFIHHMATSIQLPEVIASIAGDLGLAIDAEAIAADGGTEMAAGPSPTELGLCLDEAGAPVPAPKSGCLQFVAYDILVGIAAESGAVIRLHRRPGHFVRAGLPRVDVRRHYDAVAAMASPQR